MPKTASVDTETDFLGKAAILEAVQDLFHQATVEKAAAIRFQYRCAKLLAMYDDFRATFHTLDTATLETVVDNVADASTPSPHQESPHNKAAMVKTAREQWSTYFPRSRYGEVTAAGTPNYG